jgi:opacity protein-like surface antigen
MSHPIRHMLSSVLVALLAGSATSAAQSASTPNAPAPSAPAPSAPTEHAPAQRDSARARRMGPITAAGEPRFQGGLSFTAAQPLGAFHQYVDDGIGVGGHALYRVDREGAFALRLDGGYVNYGRETVQLPLSSRPGGGRVGLDVTTTNNIFWLGVGPHLMMPRGPVRPYVNATAGLSYFATLSSVKGRSDGDSFANDTNFDDTRFSWGGGAGVLVPVHRSARTLAFLDIGARYHNNGSDVRYLREGGVRDLPDGSIQLNPIRSRADLVTWHIGVSVGVR